MVEKVKINGKKIPKKYIPDSLSVSDRKKQIKSIQEKTMRPKLKSFKSKRSSHVEKFEKKYGTKISDFKFISKKLRNFDKNYLIFSKNLFFTLKL